MYNFLDPKLSPKVTTAAAALDDYEASNLISDDPRTRARGFMAFTSIKPPIDIHFEFLCDVQIRYVKLQTTVGSQKSLGIEILAGEARSSLGMHIYDNDEPGLIMCDSKFYNRENPPTSNSNSYKLTFFKSFQHRVFTNTNKLSIRILRTDSRSVPCLGTVEIWGYVARSVSSETKQTIHRMMNRCNEKEVLPTGASLAQSILANSKSCDFQIPEEFKDALTCEVMALPMTLPSGSTIDQTTLEKVVSNDITYGRKAADPFTGLEFLPDRKPVLNVALKSRIDLFLLKHGDRDETRTVPRTLGRTNYGEKNKRNTNYSDALRVEVPQKRRRVEQVSEHATGDNLDDAIAKVVSSGSFVCFTKRETQDGGACATCDKCGCASNLYEITVCRHLFCRPCLMTLRNCCGRCKTKFVNGAVAKVNLTR